MSDPGPNSAESRALDDAIGWVVRLQSDAVTDEDRAELLLWLSASADNQQALDDAELLWAEVDDSAELIGQALHAPSADILPMAPRKQRRPERFAPFLLAAACLAALAFISPAIWRGYVGQNVSFRTGQGETRSIKLTDGSRIELDAQSSLSVRLGWRGRRVVLSTGEASFEVAHDKSRPFLVDAGDQEIRDVGTEFNVSSYGGVVTVSVRRGIVEVRQPDLSGDASATLTMGQQLRHIVGERTSSLAAIDPDDAVAWTTGRLVCDRQPLSEIVSYLNRRFKTRIVLADAIAPRRFSGVLVLDDETQVVARLARFLSLPVRRKGDVIYLG